ncbi:hypothetical protein IZ6_25420 [Terrihabitans soli]|uniref:Uncharacterized protein n=1 Tax=Terrihabitans soli TaxID=708113 RepID=A0A6S6QV56_9HYPH|nr:hypothetical protein [Terrihabitans soli]BCJ91807.1 hypothetical protein IZ6_25420 [Terrihabitans soli]
MQITLKRALKLRKEIEATLAAAKLETRASFSLLVPKVQTDLEDVIKLTQGELIAKARRLIELSTVLRVLRIDISQANANAGVDTLLAEIADRERVMKLLKSITDAAPMASIEQLTATKDRAVKKLDDPDYSSDSLATNLVDDTIREELSKEILSLKRTKETLEDERAALNGSTRITLTKTQVETLTGFGLL